MHTTQFERFLFLFGITYVKSVWSKYLTTYDLACVCTLELGRDLLGYFKDGICTFVVFRFYYITVLLKANSHYSLMYIGPHTNQFKKKNRCQNISRYFICTNQDTQLIYNDQSFNTIPYGNRIVFKFYPSSVVWLLARFDVTVTFHPINPSWIHFDIRLLFEYTHSYRGARRGVPPLYVRATAGGKKHVEGDDRAWTRCCTGNSKFKQHPFDAFERFKSVATRAKYNTYVYRRDGRKYVALVSGPLRAQKLAFASAHIHTPSTRSTAPQPPPLLYVHTVNR